MLRFPRDRVTARLAAALCGVYLLASAWPAAAQAVRFETGRRLRLFENAWEDCDNDDARRRALVPLKRSVGEFLGGKQLQAAQSLDEARFELADEQPLPPSIRWAESLALTLEAPLVDAAAVQLAVRLAPFYETEAPAPTRPRLHLALWKDDAQVGVPVEQAIDRLPWEGALPLADVPEGDLQLEFRVTSGDATLASGRYRLSRSRGLAARLQALETASENFEQDRSSTDKQTVRGAWKLLAALAAGEVQETEYPAARLLDEAEAALAAIAAEQPFYGAAKSGQFWLRVAVPPQAWPVRIQVPAAAAENESLPLVIALHGAGGSENMFFDGYGHGAIADLCRERGWLLVAPRSLGFGLLPVDQLVAALATRYPIDKSKVFLVGHSMGAFQATAAISAGPEAFAAVAALGGSGVVRPSEALKRLPFFVAAGEQDFALSGARRLSKSLESAGVEHVTFREYPDVEHLLIVQTALGDVFHFFDEIAESPPAKTE